MGAVVGDGKHEFVRITKKRSLLEVWCSCGWMSRVGSEGDCYEFLARHISRIG
jgi:hypothetical protein